MGERAKEDAFVVSRRPSLIFGAGYCCDAFPFFTDEDRRCPTPLAVGFLLTTLEDSFHHFVDLVNSLGVTSPAIVSIIFAYVNLFVTCVSTIELIPTNSLIVPFDHIILYYF